MASRNVEHWIDEIGRQREALVACFDALAAFDPALEVAVPAELVDALAVPVLPPAFPVIDWAHRA
jgi:hypothetical protein